jgi:Ca2+-binding RTX toxin-like protein
LGLLVILAILPTLNSIAPTVLANHNFDPEESSRSESDKDLLQDIGGLHIIRGGQSPIYGTDKDDFIIGTDFADSIVAGDGDDEVQSGFSIDQIYGGRGDDSIQGGDDLDSLFGENGNDNLIGGLDDDLLVGGSGDDHLFGSFGDDQLKGNSGADFFDCGGSNIGGGDIDVVKDYNPAEGDIIQQNCEIVEP